MYDYEAFYKKYPVNQHDDPARHAAVANLAKGNLLDIACGAGTLSDYYFGPYLGLDISNTAIVKAKDVRRKDASFAVRDCTNFDGFDFSSFDTIVLCEFLEHIERDDQIFEAIQKTAKSGTRLIISCPNGDRIPCDEHVRILTIPELRRKLSHLGKVKFYNWAGVKRQILCTVDIGEKNSFDLSLVMIVKDEEKGLEQAILSCVEFVDNIVIAVDDSSVDSTAKIAEMYANDLRFFKWSDDFGAARNAAHAGVNTKWILFLDGHEYISKCENLDKYLGSKAEGLLTSIEMENGSVFRNPRIYKNGVQFEGRVHERQNCKNTEFYPDFLIKHDRLGAQSVAAAAEREKQRNDQVPRVMGAEYRKNPKNTRASFHLALHAQSRGGFRSAIFWYKKYLKYSECKGERWFACFNISLCQLALGRLFRAFWAASSADFETPGRWEILKLKGLIFFHRRKYQRAVEYFVDSFKINIDDVSYKPWVRDDAGNWNLIGECLFNLGALDRASLAFSRAAELCTNEKLKPFLEKRAELMAGIFKQRAGDSPR